MKPILIADIERLLLSASNGQECLVPESIQSMYAMDLNLPHLLTHLQMLPDIVRRNNEITGLAIRKVTNVRTICDVMNTVPGAKSLCTQLHCLLLLFLTVPVSTATAERTFSAMRRLKIYNDS